MRESERKRERETEIDRNRQLERDTERDRGEINREQILEDIGTRRMVDIL